MVDVIIGTCLWTMADSNPYILDLSTEIGLRLPTRFRLTLDNCQFVFGLDWGRELPSSKLHTKFDFSIVKSSVSQPNFVNSTRPSFTIPRSDLNGTGIDHYGDFYTISSYGIEFHHQLFYWYPSCHHSKTDNWMLHFYGAEKVSPLASNVVNIDESSGFYIENWVLNLRWVLTSHVVRSRLLQLR